MFTALAAVSTAQVALAEESAEELARRGLELGKQQKYAEAIEAFRAAFALEPSASHLCNLGMAFYGLDDLLRAHFYINRCTELAGAPVEGMSSVLEFTAAELAKAGLVLVTISSTPSASISIDTFAEPNLHTPLTVYLAAGAAAIVLELDGYRPHRESIAIASEPVTREVTLEALPVLPVKTEVVDESPPRIDVALPVGERAAGSRWRRKSAWIVGGAAVGSLAVAIVLNGRARNLNSELLADCERCPIEPGPEYDSRHDRIRKSYYGSLGFFGASALFAAASAVLFALPVADGEPLAAGAELTAGGALLNVSFRH